jgi:hypothetical protein
MYKIGRPLKSKNAAGETVVIDTEWLFNQTDNKLLLFEEKLLRSV